MGRCSRMGSNQHNYPLIWLCCEYLVELYCPGYPNSAIPHSQIKCVALVSFAGLSQVDACECRTVVSSDVWFSLWLFLLLCNCLGNQSWELQQPGMLFTRATWHLVLFHHLKESDPERWHCFPGVRHLARYILYRRCLVNNNKECWLAITRQASLPCKMRLDTNCCVI